MIASKDTIKSLLPIAFAVALALSLSSPASTQEGSKDVRSAEVRSDDVIERPAKAQGNAAAVNNAIRRPVIGRIYRASRPINGAPPNATFAKIGITVWRWKKNSQDGREAPEQKGEESVEQIEARTKLGIGDRVRLGIEPLDRGGYLYVIDREQFADGTYGTPLLIFPTLRTRQGDNEVKSNVLIQIPRAPSYFEVNPSSSGKEQVAEVLTIILSPAPLKLGAPLSNKAMALSRKLFKQWETAWSTQADALELAGGAGVVTRVKVVSTASGEGRKSLDQKEDEPLTQDDPLPQTVLRVAIKRGNPMLVTVPLRFKR